MRLSRLPGGILGTGLLVFIVLAQAAVSQSWQGGENAGSSAGSDVPRPFSIAPPADSRTPPKASQPVLFYGNVMQEDGTPPPPGAVIEMDCGGSLKRKAEVSLDGRFGFQLEDTRGLSQMLPDASEGTQYTFDREFVGEAPETRFPVRPQTALVFSGWTGCDLRARLNGYRSSILRLDGGSMAGFNEMGTIVIYPIGRVRGSAVSATSLLAPKTAKKSVEQAKKALQKKEFDKAESHLKSAVTLYPQYGEAWLRLGQLYQNQGRNEEAREAYRKAREADALQSF